MELACIKCGKGIKLWNDIPLEWKGGVVGDIKGSYSSRFAGQTFTISICDNCIIDVYFQKE